MINSLLWNLRVTDSIEYQWGLLKYCPVYISCCSFVTILCLLTVLTFLSLGNFPILFFFFLSSLIIWTVISPFRSLKFFNYKSIERLTWQKLKSTYLYTHSITQFLFHNNNKKKPNWDFLKHLLLLKNPEATSLQSSPLNNTSSSVSSIINICQFLFMFSWLLLQPILFPPRHLFPSFPRLPILNHQKSVNLDYLSFYSF